MAQSVEWRTANLEVRSSILGKLGTSLAADVLVRGVHTRDDLCGVGRSVLHSHRTEPNTAG